MWYIYKVEYYSAITTTDTCNSMEAYQKILLKPKKLDTKEYILYDSISVKYNNG